MPATISGKTVTVLHRSAFLAARAAMSPEAGQPAAAARVSRPGPGAAQILVTTFNGILAEALHAQLGLLIPDAAVRSRIEVLNVDRLAYGIVRQARGTPVIADERVLRTRWAEAAADVGLAFTPAYLKNEWEQVILAQDLRTEQAYLACPRTGRGRPLTRAQRGQVWGAQRVTADAISCRDWAIRCWAAGSASSSSVASMDLRSSAAISTTYSRPYGIPVWRAMSHPVGFQNGA